MYSHSFSQMRSLIGTVSQVSDVALGPLVKKLGTRFVFGYYATTTIELIVERSRSICDGILIQN